MKKLFTKQDFGVVVSAIFVFVLLTFLNSTAYSQTEFPLTADYMWQGDKFGKAVAVDGDFAIVGAPRQDIYMGSLFAKIEDVGAAYIFRKGRGRWHKEAKLTINNPKKDTYFGTSVDICDNLVIVGAPGDQHRSGSIGSVYIFERSLKFGKPQWSQKAILTAGDATTTETDFGYSVSITRSSDCFIDYLAIIGVPKDDDMGPYSGSAYIFQCLAGKAGGWSQMWKLVNPDAGRGDMFGCSVSIDGDLALVGSKIMNLEGANSGRVFVFKKWWTNWYLEQSLNPDNACPDDGFGKSVSIDGDLAIIGAPNYDDVSMGLSQVGSAYVFKRTATSTGANWQQEERLYAPDGESQDQFGFSVAVSGDLAIVGIPYCDDNSTLTRSGAAYIFKRSENVLGSWWSLLAKLTASAPQPFDYFGESVDIDGDLAIVGAPGNQIFEAGQAYIYTNMPLSKFNTQAQREVSTFNSVPDKLALEQNHPNPFNPETSIGYQIADRDFVVLKVYNLLGREVRTLVNEEQNAGYYSVHWDGRNNSGEKLPSGVYVYRLVADKFVECRKMTLVK